MKILHGLQKNVRTIVATLSVLSLGMVNAANLDLALLHAQQMTAFNTQLLDRTLVQANVAVENKSIECGNQVCHKKDIGLAVATLVSGINALAALAPDEVVSPAREEAPLFRTLRMPTDSVATLVVTVHEIIEQLYGLAESGAADYPALYMSIHDAALALSSAAKSPIANAACLTETSGALQDAMVLSCSSKLS